MGIGVGVCFRVLESYRSEEPCRAKKLTVKYARHGRVAARWCPPARARLPQPPSMPGIMLALRHGPLSQASRTRRVDLRQTGQMSNGTRHRTTPNSNSGELWRRGRSRRLVKALEARLQGWQRSVRRLRDAALGLVPQQEEEGPHRGWSSTARHRTSQHRTAPAAYFSLPGSLALQAACCHLVGCLAAAKAKPNR